MAWGLLTGKKQQQQHTNCKRTKQNGHSKKKEETEETEEELMTGRIILCSPLQVENFSALVLVKNLSECRSKLLLNPLVQMNRNDGKKNTKVD